jgi:phosphoribosylformylglycinamidine synthase
LQSPILGLAPIRYVDEYNVPTEEYPMNPNGSPVGIAAICSPDGRHLAMMPHPERCFLPWQQPYVPFEWMRTMMTAGVAPWFKMFQNAKKFCDDFDV